MEQGGKEGGGEGDIGYGVSKGGTGDHRGGLVTLVRRENLHDT